MSFTPVLNKIFILKLDDLKKLIIIFFDLKKIDMKILYSKLRAKQTIKVVLYFEVQSRVILFFTFINNKYNIDIDIYVIT